MVGVRSSCEVIAWHSVPPANAGWMDHQRQMVLLPVGVGALAPHLVIAAQLAMIGREDTMVFLSMPLLLSASIRRSTLRSQSRMALK